MSQHIAPWISTGEPARVVVDGVPVPTIFEKMTGLANEFGAVNLGQGFPDIDGPQWIREAAAKALIDGDVNGIRANQYAPGSGLPILREALATHYKRTRNIEYDPQSNILITTGATEGIAAAILAYVSPGEEVITFEPCYDSYSAIIGLSGARQVSVRMEVPAFQPDPQALRDAITDKTRMVVLNTPHNPSGKIIAADVLREIVQICAEHSIWVVSDEVYEQLCFESEHVSADSVSEGYERLITVSSAGKSLSLTGWKVGWALTQPEVVEAMRTVKQFLTYSSGPAFQIAVAQALNSVDAFNGYLSDLKGNFATQRDALISALNDLGLEPVTPDAGYFTVVDLSGWGVHDAADYAETMARDHGIVGVPVSALCSPGNNELASWMRFAFCKSSDVMAQAIERFQAMR